MCDQSQSPYAMRVFEARFKSRLHHMGMHSAFHVQGGISCPKSFSSRMVSARNDARLTQCQKSLTNRATSNT